VLAVDVGCGTTDMLLWDSSMEGENQIHLIVPSATRVVAAEIGEATRRGLPVVFAGPLMGGGPNMEAMKLHVARGLPFLATPSAAASFDDDLRAVAAMGVTVVGEDEIGGPGDLSPRPHGPGLRDAVWVRSGDLRFADLLRALSLVGVAPSLDGCAVAGGVAVVLNRGGPAPGSARPWSCTRGSQRPGISLR
jgi:uncharacterized protein (DUF1786 family)